MTGLQPLRSSEPQLTAGLFALGGRDNGLDEPQLHPLAHVPEPERHYQQSQKRIFFIIPSQFFGPFPWLYHWQFRE
jgi:hypothetical protein